MLVFKLWSNFGVFRDPITITQNMTLTIPPKTTIGGILAAIMGIDYNDYFNDSEYFDFKYSIVLEKSIRKKSFCQNYVEDYTKNSELRYSAINDLFMKETELNQLCQNNKEFKNIDKKLKKYFDDISRRMQKPKPIYREILLNPSYLIFINQYKYEKELISFMKKHHSFFSLYMGNSEFSANYEFLECIDVKECLINNVSSFTGNLDKIKFEVGKKYTTIYFATKVMGKREYRDYKKLVICDKKISFKDNIKNFSIKLPLGVFNCEFI